MNARARTIGVLLLLSACSTEAPTGVGRTTEALKGGAPNATATNVVGVVNARTAFTSTCTGSLLAPNLVLVARSCVSTLAGGGGTSCATSIFDPPGGTLDVTTSAEIAVDAGTNAHVDKVLVPTDDHVCGNDLALLILGRTLPATVTPLIPRLEVAPTKGETYTAIGFGAIDGTGNDSGVRRQLTGLAVTCVDACDSIGATAGKEIGGAAGPCNGDNGSPAIDGAGTVFAISSRGPGACAAGLYTRLDAFAAFLKAGALEAATKGGYPAPSWATSPADAGTDAPLTDSSPGDSGAPLDSSLADAGDDAGAATDAGATTPGSVDSSGCSCAVAGTPSSSPVAGAVLGLCLGAALRRGRRRRPRSG